MRMLHVKGWGWLEGDTKWTPESPAKSVPAMVLVHYYYTSASDFFHQNFVPASRLFDQIKVLTPTLVINYLIWLQN